MTTNVNVWEQILWGHDPALTKGHVWVSVNKQVSC